MTKSPMMPGVIIHHSMSTPLEGTEVDMSELMQKTAVGTGIDSGSSMGSRRPRCAQSFHGTTRQDYML